VRWDSGSESVFVPSAGSLRSLAMSRLRRAPVTPDLSGWRVGAPAWSGPAVVSGPSLPLIGGAAPC
jgi:hypothetical protein